MIRNKQINKTMELKLKAGDSLNIPEGCKAVIKDNVVVFEKVQDFKDGDILVSVINGKRRHAFIYKSTDNMGYHSYYIGLNGDTNISISNFSDKWGSSALSYATEEEKQLLFDKMKEQGLQWNAEEKRVEKIRWRAENGEKYYYVSTEGFALVDKEEGHIVDENRYKFGNCFRTKEQAEETAKRMKEVLRKYHEEIGE